MILSALFCVNLRLHFLDADIRGFVMIISALFCVNLRLPVAGCFLNPDANAEYRFCKFA